MNKIEAIRVSTAWSDSETLKGELKVELNSIQYQAILTNIDNYDTTLSYLSGIIWKYYKSYYLTTSTKERCVELLANELSGKLNYYYALINQYKEAYNKNYETIRSSENTNDRNITTSRTGFNKQATTPETIDAGAEYIDNYSTSQQKYNSSGTELGKNTFKSNISGSSKELWENINAIPKRIYEGIIGLVSKYFFYVYDDDLVPCVELTLEQAIKELNEKVGILDNKVVNIETQVEKNDTNIRTIGGIVDDLQRRERVITESIENLTKVTPTDIAVKDNKLGLEHDNVWLTNQKAINLGSNMEYDATTNTLNAKGGGSSTTYYQHCLDLDLLMKPNNDYRVRLNIIIINNTPTKFTKETFTITELGKYVNAPVSGRSISNVDSEQYKYMILRSIYRYDLKNEKIYFSGTNIYPKFPTSGDTTEGYVTMNEGYVSANFINQLSDNVIEL